LTRGRFEKEMGFERGRVRKGGRLNSDKGEKNEVSKG
jgi:hypothetical protein